MGAQAFRPSPGGLAIADDYRVGVEFEAQDVRTRMPDGPFHLIFCRNVVFTYFDEELQRRLVAGGALVIGASESLPEGTEGLEPWPGGRKVYRRLPRATD
jgi:chemotaxis protein methyltransferase CheR